MNGDETVLVNLIYLFQAILFTLHKPDLISFEISGYTLTELQ